MLVFLLTVSVALGRSLSGLTRDLPTYAAGLDALRAVPWRSSRRGASTSRAWRSPTSSARAGPWASPRPALSWVAGAFGDGFLVFFLATIMLAHFAALHRRDGDGGTVAAGTFAAELEAVTGGRAALPPDHGHAPASPSRSSSRSCCRFSGVPYALVWGVLSFFLNFVPQVGIILSWVPPAVLAMVTYGWSRALTVILAYTVINFVIDNVLKPRFMATGLHISFLAVMLSLLFWGWVLGPAGAILSVPLTLAVRRFRPAVRCHTAHRCMRRWHDPSLHGEFDARPRPDVRPRHDVPGRPAVRLSNRPRCSRRSGSPVTRSAGTARRS
ncbi:MAG: AI-2E family transporter [Ignavibacteriales bacterium]|nr:AI-2E family transporter [Ignavibacteriales bacterium]